MPTAAHSDNAPVVLKWRIAAKEDDLVPFTLNFWPSSEVPRVVMNARRCLTFAAQDGHSVVSVEVSRVNTALDLTNVYISIPCRWQQQQTGCDGSRHPGAQVIRTAGGSPGGRRPLVQPEGKVRTPMRGSLRARSSPCVWQDAGLVHQPVE
jgi:hypothetical protein